jgi:prepilin-type N-terminal cleavage/methylation domain-containing protein
LKHKTGVDKLKSQRGFTIFELLISLAIAAIVAAAAGTTVVQVVKSSNIINNNMTALNNVRSAGEWLSRDGRNANTCDSVFNLTPSSGTLTMTWTDYSGVLNTVVYTISSDNTLVRTYSGGAGPAQTMTAATHISAVSGSATGNTIAVSAVTAAAGSQSLTMTYRIAMRS